MNWSYALLRSIRVFAWAAFLVSAWRLSVKDWRVQKIKHRELAVGALFVAAVYGLLAFNTVLGLAGLTRSWYRGVFFRDLAVHLLLTAVAALGLWRARVWPAGDAKLFFLLGAVAPLLTREPSFQGGRFFFSALINIFLPACLFVFAQVAWYVWHTRLKHTLGYLREAGLKRAWDISMAAARPAARRGLLRLLVRLRRARRSPRRALLELGRWAAIFVCMAGLSAAAHAYVSSATVRSALSFAFLYLIMRASKGAGDALVWGGAAATVAVCALEPAGAPFRADLATAAGSLTFFGVFLELGAVWTTSLLGGRVPMILLPFAGMLLGFVAMAAGTARSMLARFTPFFSLAGLGAFFGLCYVFVRIWEDEDRPEIPLEALRAYMLPHPSFVRRAEEEDPDFHERHLSDLYADGLTRKQAKAVRGWARRRELATVPIQTTMSFAFWIFLGYFLTWALGGQVLERLL